MIRKLLPALALTPVALSVLADAAATDVPSLPPVQTRNCFDASDEDGVGGLGSVGYGRGGGGASASTRSAAAGKGSSGVLGGVLGGTVGGISSSGASAAPAPAPPPPAEKRAEAAADAAPAMPMPASAPAEEAEGRSLRDAEVTPQQQARYAPPGPRVDWGGTTYLSNDDSMSLASAQRLLYALERGVDFSVGQIRPHELLNYFTFDTLKPRGRDTFAVHASAQRRGDTLDLALAVQAASPPRPEVDLTLVLDRSGSMRSDGRMETARRALTQLTGQLRRGDLVDLVLFDHTVCTPVKNFVVGRDDPRILSDAIQRTQPRGSTDLDAGLKEGYGLATAHRSAASGRAGRVMVFTDAVLNTGDVNPHTVSEVGRHLDQHGIRLTGVGVGLDFRDDVLDRLTEKGKGAYVFLGSDRVVDRLFGAGADALLQTVAHDVQYELKLPPDLGLTRFYGEESSTRAEDVQPVHVHAGTSQLFLQELAIRDGRLDERGEAVLTVRWDDPVSGRRTSQTFSVRVADALAADTHNVRKARALMGWTDVLTAHALGSDACGAPLRTYRERLGGLMDDAEIAYTADLVGRFCGTVTPMEPPALTWAPPASDFKVKVDADQPIAEVQLACPAGQQQAALTAGESVARFRTTPGSCRLTLYGAVPMTVAVQVPSTGGDVRCTLRGGRVSCS